MSSETKGHTEGVDMLNVTVGDGKYTVIQDADGRLRALRYGEEWRDCCGDGLILQLAYEVAELRQRQGAVERLVEAARAVHARMAIKGDVYNEDWKNLDAALHPFVEVGHAD